MGMAVDAIQVTVFEIMRPFCQKIRALNMTHAQGRSMIALLRLVLLLGVGLLAVAFAHAGGAPATARVLGTELQTRDAQELQSLIMQKLFDHYAQERGLAVSPAEIAAYQAEKQRFMDEDRRRREARRTELTEQLQTKTLSGEQRNALAKELEALDSLAGMETNASAEESAEVRAYAEQIARAFILRRKINRALYQQYGGRVIFQQLGPEPLDAYRTFLQEQAALENFRIFDEELEKEFWRYFKTDAMHQFYPPGSAEEARAFDQSVPASPAK